MIILFLSSQLFLANFLMAASMNLKMPNVEPKVHDTYLCNAYKVEGGKPLFITKFVPHVSMEKAHHMLLFGCSKPGQSDEKPWNCGEMSADGKTDDQFKNGPVCSEGYKIMYGWAMDAKALDLPKDVGFEIGGKSQIDYLVLQIHYKEPQKSPDSSGLELITTTTPQPKRAGTYIMGTAGSIPAHSVTYLETACNFESDIPIYPFAYRVHAHKHGVVNSGYRIRDGKWTEIGRKSPQLPQMFYKVSTPGMDIRKDDMLAARCVMNNTEGETVQIGPTNDDEMCNFYFMFYVKGTKLPETTSCWASTQNDQELKLLTEGMPIESSMIPGTKEILKAERLMDNMFDQFEDNFDPAFLQERYFEEDPEEEMDSMAFENF